MCGATRWLAQALLPLRMAGTLLWLQPHSQRPRPAGEPPRPAAPPDALQRIAELAASSSDPDLLPALVEQSCAIVGARLAVAGSYDPNTGELVVLAASGTGSAEWAGRRLSWPWPAGAGTNPVLAENACDDLRVAPLCGLLGPHAQAAVALLPLHTEGQPAGLLLLAGAPGTFAPATLALAQLLAGLATGALVQRQLREQASQAARARASILDTISHEFRTPITVILGFTELYQEGVLGAVSGEQLEALEAIHRNTGRLLKLVDGMLDLARIEAGELELLPTPVNIELCFHEIQSQLADHAGAVQAAFDADLPHVWADALWLRRALLGLLTFALDIAPGQPLHLCACPLAPGAHELRLELLVPGLRLSSAEQAAFFEIFRAEASARPAGILARLGLALGNHAIMAMGGRLQVEQREAGACFVLALRVAELAGEV